VRLLRVYPPAWRARYGEELSVLIEEIDAGARMSWRLRLDVVRAGVVERARALGLKALLPRDRAREGTLLVLYAWMLFVLGGFGVQRASEHWKAVTPTAKRALPSAAFDVLFLTAGVGSLLVLVGVAVSLPRLIELLRKGGWAQIRRRILRAALLTLVTAAATKGLVAWAHALSPAARNGGDHLYGGVFLAWVLLFAACLFAWANAAAATARNLTLPLKTLRTEVRLGAAVSAAMAVMTIATAVWWGALADAAPWFFDGRPPGSNASALASNMIAPVLVMLCAASLGLIGATRAMKALTGISPSADSASNSWER
jgi:hypothetical protein